jgi:hypothetical protein
MIRTSPGIALEPVGEGPSIGALTDEGRMAIAACLGLLAGLLALAPAATPPQIAQAIHKAAAAAGVRLEPDALEFLQRAELGVVDVPVCIYCGCTERAPCQLESGSVCGWYVQRAAIAVCTNPTCMRAYLRRCR